MLAQRREEPRSNNYEHAQYEKAQETQEVRLFLFASLRGYK